MRRVAAFFGFAIFVLVLVSCVTQSYPTPTASPPRTSVEVESLPLRLRWTQQLPGTILNAWTPLACAGDRGAAITESHMPSWHGLVIFDDQGQVLQHYPEEWASAALAMNDKRLYVVKLPELRAYEIETGELAWSTREGLEYRLVPHLFLNPDGTLVLQAFSKVNTYRLDDGTLLDSKTFPNRDLVQRSGNLEFHSPEGEYSLYAIDTENGGRLTWETDLSAQGVLLISDGHLIGEYLIPGNGVQVCSVRMDDGQIAWCEKKSLISNIVMREGIGYAVNNQDELIGFQLDTGEDVGQVVFNPASVDVNPPHVAVCEGHLLVFMPTPDELFWFEFLTTTHD